MWKHCRSVFDEPVMIFVWEWDEFMMGLGTFGIGQFFIGPSKSTLIAAAALLFIYRVKKGKPAGAVVHWLHRLELPCFRLPGVLPVSVQPYGPWA